MILTIPYQTLEINNIHLTPFQFDKYGRAIAKFTYKNESVDIQDVSILTPPLKIIDITSSPSHIHLDLSNQPALYNKLKSLQDYLVSTFYMHQQSFLNCTNQSIEDIAKLFMFILKDSVLSLYTYPNSVVNKDDGTTIKINTLKQGDYVRSVIKLHGISQIFNSNNIRLRLHHTVPSMWLVLDN
jgi:hypothetical protein